MQKIVLDKPELLEKRKRLNGKICIKNNFQFSKEVKDFYQDDESIYYLRKLPDLIENTKHFYLWTMESPMNIELLSFEKILYRNERIVFAVDSNKEDFIIYVSNRRFIVIHDKVLSAVNYRSISKVSLVNENEKYKVVCETRNEDFVLYENASKSVAGEIQYIIENTFNV